VVPKGAYVSFDDFSAKASPEEIVGYVRAIGEVARMLGVSESGYRILANHGANSHQEVPHLHVHIFGGRRLGPMLSKD
jgi:histidine triad (HIT) family protein